MKKTKIGFVPAHREPFDEDWAIEMKKRVLKSLEPLSEKGITLVHPDEYITKNGLVRDDEDAEKAIEFFKDKDLEGIMIGAMTFGDEISAATIAQAMPELPVLLFSTKEGPFTPEGSRKSDAFCGTLSIASGLYRRKIPFVFLGNLFPEEEKFIKGVEDFARTCKAVKRFLGARIGLVGPRPERFETCAINEFPMIEQFGQKVVQKSLVEIFNRANNIQDQEKISQIVEEIKKVANCQRVKPETLEKSARLEIALEEFAREKRLDALAVQCWTAMQEIYGISSCLAMGRLTQKGIMTACEVDIHGALTMLVQYMASLEETVPHFIDWTIQHQSKPNVFLAWHCGNAPLSLKAPDSEICINYHSILSKAVGEENSGGTAEFQLKPGIVTISRIVEYDGIFKMFITTGKIIPSTDTLRGSWSWVEVEDLELVYRTLVQEGFTHHASLIHGDLKKALADFCQLTGMEAVVV